MQKWPFFQVSLLGNIDQINVSYDILELKERLSTLKKQQDILEKKTVFLEYKNNKFKKVEKLRFFQRG